MANNNVLRASNNVLALGEAAERAQMEEVLKAAGASHLLSKIHEEEVDLEMLSSATQQELTDLGFCTMGQRKKLQAATRSAIGNDNWRKSHSYYFPETTSQQRDWSGLSHVGDRSTFTAQGGGHPRWRHTFRNSIRRSMKRASFAASDAGSVVDRQVHNNETGWAFQPWGGRLESRPASESSPSLRQLLANPQNGYTQDSRSAVASFVYSVLVGWWTALIYVIIGVILMATCIGWKHGMWCLKFARYLLSPFGMHVGRIPISNRSFGDSQPCESTPLATTPPGSTCTKENGQTGSSVLAGYIFRIVVAVFAGIPHVVICGFSWLCVWTIPTAGLHKQILEVVLLRDPLSFCVCKSQPTSTDDVEICYNCPVNSSYFGHEVWGVNIILLNFLLFVPPNFFFKFAASEEWVEENSVVVMICSLIAIIPLSYFIGHSVAAVSAQTSFFIGAILNATFGSIIELIIYFVALSKGLNDLVVSATTGALLACMLLLPGLSMVAGGYHFKEQMFNRKAGNVSAIMLLVAVTGLFMPSIYYNIFRRTQISCNDCDALSKNLTSISEPRMISSDAESDFHGEFHCGTCNTTSHDYSQDSVYKEHVEPMMYAVAVLLLTCYFVGLLFTLHTHSFIYDAEPEEPHQIMTSRSSVAKKRNTENERRYSTFGEREPEPFIIDNKMQCDAEMVSGHHGPSWSTRTCIIVMLSATACFAIVSEALVDALTPSLNKIGISENFAGLTIIAIIPCIAEFVNAIQFAIADNIKLSLEIGNLAAIQMILVQIPVLTFGSVAMGKYYPDDGFVLVYPPLNLFAVFMATLVLTYVLVDGTSNYFQGAALLVIYVIMIMTFYHVPHDHNGSAV